MVLPTAREGAQSHPAWHFWAGLGLLFLGVVPAWALATYPGWWRTAEGYFPYFNALAWQRHPALFWRPPYIISDLPLPWPLPEAVVTLFMTLGMDALSALRGSFILALILGASGTYITVSRVFSPWAALAAGLSWAYGPYTLALVYRLGHARQIWLWVVILWLMWPLVLSVGVARVRRYGWIFLPFAAAAWLPAVLPARPFASELAAQHLSPAWGVFTALGPWFVAWFLDRWRLGHPVIALAVGALCAQAVLPNIRPHYVAYTPPAEPVAIFQDYSIVLLEVSLEGRLEPGSTLLVSAYWQVLRPQQVNWTVFNQVLDPSNRIWGQFDGLVGSFTHPTSTWAVGEVNGETYEIAIRPDAPKELRLIMGLYQLETMQRLPLVNGADHVEVARSR